MFLKQEEPEMDDLKEKTNFGSKGTGTILSIGAKIFCVKDLKKKTLKKNLSNIKNQFHILLNDNLNYFVCSAQL